MNSIFLLQKRTVRESKKTKAEPESLIYLTTLSVVE
jgi:hypothetical protein